MMLLTPEDVGDVPVVGSGFAGSAGATLDVAGRYLLSSLVPADVGSYRGPRDGAAGGGEILAAPSTDLMTNNAANDGAEDCPGHVGSAAILNHLFALDPASLLRWPDHRAY